MKEQKRKIKFRKIIKTSCVRSESVFLTTFSHYCGFQPLEFEERKRKADNVSFLFRGKIIKYLSTLSIKKLLNFLERA